jgi:tRNA threonylcarbamoyladenosine biosynthesis protein TsaE
MQPTKLFISSSSEETFNFAKKFALSVEYGSIILFKGDLGSGKTTFSKGFSKGLGFDDVILSPTYPILNEYNSNDKSLYHFDLYRLKSMVEFLEIGGLEYLNSYKAITLVEWPELIENIDMINKIEIEFEHISENERSITVL